MGKGIGFRGSGLSGFGSTKHVTVYYCNIYIYISENFTVIHSIENALDDHGLAWGSRCLWSWLRSCRRLAGHRGQAPSLCPWAEATETTCIRVVVKIRVPFWVP